MAGLQCSVWRLVWQQSGSLAKGLFSRSSEFLAESGFVVSSPLKNLPRHWRGFLSQAIVTLVMASVTAQTPLTGDRRGHVEWVNCLVPKAREDRLQQVFFDARRWLSVLFNTKDTRLYGDFLGSRKWSKDRLQFPRMAFIFVRRGHGEFIHTRRSRESDPMAGRTPSPARAIVGDIVLRC